LYETEGESSASSAADGLAIPDNNDASSRVLLPDGLSRIGVPACGIGVSDDDDSVANLDRFHGDSCSGNSVCISARIDTSSVNKPLACLGRKGHDPQEALPQRPLSTALGAVNRRKAGNELDRRTNN
jgi:hypothetical protein